MSRLRGPAADEFERWVASSAPALHRSAFLLTGDWATAQDLVQHACVETWAKWSSVETPDAFARVVMARAASKWWRRRWRSDTTLDVVAEPGTVSDPFGDVDRQDALVRALQALPARSRAVLVLRFFDDLSEADTAAALGWPVGTVKSTTSRALAALRAAGLQDLDGRHDDDELERGARR